MNDNDLESLLTGLTPRAPSVEMRQRVAAEMELDRQWMRAPVRHRATWRMPAFWASVGAAAAVLVMTVMQPAATSSPVSIARVSAPQSVMPVSTIREMVDAQDEGIQYNQESQLPEQHVKLVSVERHAWIDPRDGAHITVEMPREDSVILPVSFQ